MGNRERILEAAVELMNKNGSVVGTNQLSDHLAISPGNLYYHFRNREEILIEVLARLQADLDEVLELAPNEAVDAGRLARCFVGGAQVLWRYRFFFSSSMELVMKDENLRRQFRSFCTRGTAQVNRILKHVLRDAPGEQRLTPAERDKLAENMWVLWVSWPRYTELVQGTLMPEGDIMRSHEHLAFLLKPFLSRDYFRDVMRCARKMLK